LRIGTTGGFGFWLVDGGADALSIEGQLGSQLKSHLEVGHFPTRTSTGRVLVGEPGFGDGDDITLAVESDHLKRALAPFSVLRGFRRRVRNSTAARE